MKRNGFAVALVFFLLLFTSCGYHVAGHASSLPPDIKTVAVPVFSNQTQTYKIEQRLTKAVMQEMLTRTRYHVVPDVSDDADAVLRGTVLATNTTPLTYDSQTGRVASVLVVVNVKIELTDRHGTVIYQNPSYLAREQYQISTELNNFFEEDSAAFDRLARDFAQNMVSTMLEGF